ncbi:Nn.00g116410.m01.CDS01 [Neocucurbitaria sp. VM-36]
MSHYLLLEANAEIGRLNEELMATKDELKAAKEELKATKTELEASKCTESTKVYQPVKPSQPVTHHQGPKATPVQVNMKPPGSIATPREMTVNTLQSVKKPQLVNSKPPGSKAPPREMIVGGHPPLPQTPESQAERDELVKLFRKLPKWDPAYRTWMLFVNPSDIECPDSVRDLEFWQPEAPLPLEGKVDPAVYGSIATFDLGLCDTTFCTDEACELGADCPWRHAPLTWYEKEWITQLGMRYRSGILNGSSTPVLEHMQTRWDPATKA